MNLQQDATVRQPRFNSGSEMLAWRLQWWLGRQELLAREATEKDTAQTIALTLGCSVISAKKFGDRLAIGYRITSNRTDQESWIWGAERPMNQVEIEAYLRSQAEAYLAAC